jgi:hypothetical protein
LKAEIAQLRAHEALLRRDFESELGQARMKAEVERLATKAECEVQLDIERKRQRYFREERDRGKAEGRAAKLHMEADVRGFKEAIAKLEGEIYSLKRGTKSNAKLETEN